MITLTVIEQQIHRVLLDRARSGDPAEPLQSCLTYLELGRIVDPQGLRARGPAPNTSPPFRGLNIALGHISWYEFDHGRPMLSALVVNAETRRPGDGFADLARQRGIEVADPGQFWREQVTRSVTFWSGADVVYVLDAAMARVLDELAEIRRLLRAAAGRGMPAAGPPPRG